MRDSITIVTGSTFTNQLTLTNTGTKPQDVRLAIDSPEAVTMLASVPDKLQLAPGEKRLIPIKGLLHRQIISANAPVRVRMSDAAGNPIQFVACQLIAKGSVTAAVSLYTPQETMLLYAANDAARLPLHLTHNRADAETYTIEISALPQGMAPASFPTTIALKPRQDTILTVTAVPLRQWSANTPYQLIVTVRDRQKAIVGSVVYKMVVAVADKVYQDALPTTGSGYGASVALTRFSTNQWARETRVWGTDSVGKARLEMNLHYLDYGTDHFRQLQNSYIALTTAQTAVRLGSVYDFHELPLFGRGLKISTGPTDRQWTFWAVNANHNWLSSDRNAWRGNVYSARYDRQLAKLPGAALSLSTSHYTLADVQRAGYLTFASFRYNHSDRHSMQIMAGQSVEFAPHRASSAQVTGWAGQLEYAYQRERFSWQLRSYKSSPAYAGLQRGATLLYSQLFWQPAPVTTVLARLNYLSYDRVAYTSPTDFARHRFGNAVAEVSMSHRIGSLTMSARPYWFSQRDEENPVSQRADAFRLAPVIAYRRRSDQYLELTYDVGRFYGRTDQGPSAGILSQRVVSSLGIGRFNVWGYWQKGPYYLFDLRTTYPGLITTTSLTPTVSFALLNRRLSGSVGLNYLYNATTTDARYTAVGRVQYDATPNLSVYLSGNGTPYSEQPEFAYSQYRMEIVQRFNRLQAKRHGKLQLAFFEDANGNGSRDADERWMDSLLVRVNDNTLLTNASGRVVYRHIPPGTYAVSAISTGRIGDPVLYQEQLTIVRSVSKEVPLSRTFRIAGRLQCQTSAYDHQPCQFSRFSLDVRQNQQSIATVAPLPDGTFSVHLSPGTYTLLLHDYGRQPHTTVKALSLTVSNTGQYPAIDWTVDGSTRPVEIKRFSTSK
ncbi:COG1470 family protein [Spirosoma rhododendri]|uniref:SD-repeat containing protein B domain-containing protein n=1 Tax=Spirosoma rhododendri TaxID=2728024 RepID=A0A7L5DU39_9BACT|nr:hypothetical protein [Spirosoma rhododendri]QJD80981.1 hypothetical protein HH216_23070 [Spirosoma rhododendri]